MKILLVGEYSRSHNSLKEGLIKLGHEVTIIGLSDGFKNYPIDIPFKRKYMEGFSGKIKSLLFKFFKIDITSLNIKNQFLKKQELFKNYDIVQLINETSFLCDPKTEQEIFDFLKKWNKKIFLLSGGTDYPSIKYAYEKKFRYSILTPYFNGKILSKKDLWALKYLKPNYVKLHKHIYKNINGVIASDIDYHIPLLNYSKYIGLVPNCINTDKIKSIPTTIDTKIIIFHGINAGNYFKKGNDLFDEALVILEKKLANKVKIIRTENVPYEEYIKSYDSCHILLDQVYAYDQGYNALEAMAKGKVVFTGAEQEWLEMYKLEEDTIAINALPSVPEIVNKLEWLVNNPQKIIEISSNARAFIEKEHHYVKSAQRYLDKWNSY